MTTTDTDTALIKLDQARSLAEMLEDAEGDDFRKEAFRTMPGIIADLLRDAQAGLERAHGKSVT